MSAAAVIDLESYRQKRKGVARPAPVPTLFPVWVWVMFVPYR